MKNEKCCGNCDYFTDEDSNGNGWCGLYDWETFCDEFCDEFDGEIKNETVHHPNKSN